MACKIEITSVAGGVDVHGNLTSITIQGTAQDCRRVGVTAGCGHEHYVEADVKNDGSFLKPLTGDDLDPTECSCGASIAVRVVCLDELDCKDSWEDELRCEEAPEPPRDEHRPAKPPNGGGEWRGPGTSGCEKHWDLTRECQVPEAAEGPQYVIPFHQLLGFLPLGTPDDDFEPSQPPPSLAAAKPLHKRDLRVE